MRHSQHSQSRGAALLIVLATLVLVAVSVTTIARRADLAQVRRDLDRSMAVADDLLREAEKPILHWLATAAQRQVLPPDVEEPRVDVLRERWEAAELPCEVSITAWDQCGMVPFGLTRRGSPLRGTLPDPVLQVLDRKSHRNDEAIGLDLFYAPGALPSPFPSPPIPQTEDAERFPLPPALGGVVATHNTNEPAILNAATAPLPVIERALSWAQRGGLDLIRDARERGELPVLSNVRNTNETEVPQLTTSSVSWSFRIDIRVGSLKRSWWAVYHEGDAGQWSCVQRLVLPH